LLWETLSRQWQDRWILLLYGHCIQKRGGTQPFLEHSGFKETADLALYPIMNEGWLKNIQKIATLINTVKHGSTNT